MLTPSSIKPIKQGDTLFNCAVLIVYSLLTFIAVLHHEAWRDEAQTWLLVRDLNLTELFSKLSTQGHLCLWYVILFPVVKLGLPYFSMQIIHWLLVVFTASVFLFKAPLNKFIKVFFLLSYYMLFEYGVVATDYILTILFLFLIAASYPSRFINPKRYALLILLLCNCHILGFGAALALMLIYFIECRRNKINNSFIPLIIMMCGAVLTVLQLLPAANAMVDATVPTGYLPHINSEAGWTILTSVKNAFIPITANYIELKTPLFFFICLCLLFVSLIKRKNVLFILLISLAWIFYVFVTKVSGYWRYDGMILVCIIFCLWIKQFSPDKENYLSTLLGNKINYAVVETTFTIFLVLCLIVNSVFGISGIKKEYTSNYSGATEMATFIKQHNLEGNEIATYQCWSVSVAAYLPKTKLWSVEIQKYQSFMITDSVFIRNENLSYREIMNRIKEKYKTETLLLVGEPLPITTDSTVTTTLLFENEQPNWADNNERYWLYKVR